MVDNAISKHDGATGIKLVKNKRSISCKMCKTEFSIVIVATNFKTHVRNATFSLEPSRSVSLLKAKAKPSRARLKGLYSDVCNLLPM